MKIGEKQRNDLVTAVIGIILDLALVWALFQYYNIPAYLLGFLVLLLGYVMKKTSEIKNRRLYACSAVFSFLLSASCVVGAKVNITRGEIEPLYRHDAVYFLALAAVFFFFFSWLASLILEHPFALAAKAELTPKRVWVACSVLLFICWIPCFFVFCPGTITNDSMSCINQAIGRDCLSSQQSVFYILLMKPFLLVAQSIGKSLGLGAAMFLLFQAAAMAALIGYFPCWLASKGFPRWVISLAMAYFILNPVFAMYSISMWKDILFSALLFVYVLNVYDIQQSSGKWLESRSCFPWFILSNVLLAFMRNNGYYIIFVTLIVIAVSYRKSWKRLVPAFLAVLIIIPVIQGPVYNACGVAQSPFAESVGIPLQQIGYTVKNNGKITPEQSKFLDQLLPLDEMKRAYTPDTSNGIKFYKDFNDSFLEKNKGQFLKVWGEMLAPNAGKYLKSYIMETLGYWHVGTTDWVLCYGVSPNLGESNDGIYMPNICNLAKNRSSIEQTFNNLQNVIPILSWLVNIGFLFWTAAFSAMMLIIRKKGKVLLTYLPLLLLWGTLMVAAPTFCEFRYMFAFAIALPALIVFMFPTRTAS